MSLFVKTLKYKGYTADVYWDEDVYFFYGQLNDIRDLVTFEAKGVFRTAFEFRRAVNRYITLCEKKGKEPDNP